MAYSPRRFRRRTCRRRGRAGDGSAARTGAPRAASPRSRPETVNDDPTDDLLADDEGPGVLRAQVMLDRAHFSGGVLNGKAGQNLEKAV